MATPVLVVGHKNPDNDSIAASVGFAYYKNEMMKRKILMQKNMNIFLVVLVLCQRNPKLFFRNTASRHLSLFRMFLHV